MTTGSELGVCKCAMEVQVQVQVQALCKPCVQVLACWLCYCRVQALGLALSLALSDGATLNCSVLTHSLWSVTV